LFAESFIAPQEMQRESIETYSIQTDQNREGMWIGVFDSGLGGLALAESIRRRLPQYNYLYLGDTKRVPYGNRSQQSIHEFVSQALNFLFDHDCRLVILACNTASAEALRKTQQEYLPRFYPERRILGVLIPTVEAAVAAPGSAGGCGILATQSTVESGAYLRELDRIGFKGKVVQAAAPLLVPLIENDGMKYIAPVVSDYLEPLCRQGVRTLLLACTHYSLIKELIRESFDFEVVSQDEVVPDKLAHYLARHPEMEGRLTKGGEVRYCVTDITHAYEGFARKLIGGDVNLERVTIE
jgi:glutamate racemase